MILSATLAILSIFISIVFHEVAHGWVAYKLGDDTAKINKRLSLNPIKHIDTFGTVILPLFLFFSKIGFIFGWAKPVPVNYNKLKKKQRDIILVSSAGIMANFILAFLSSIMLKLTQIMPPHFLSGILAIFFFNMIAFNIFLALFNLLPIPPLDGSKIILGWSRNKKIQAFLSSDKQGLITIMLLLFIIPSIFKIFGISFNPVMSILRYFSLNLINILT